MNKEIENGIIFLIENFFRKNSLYLVGSGISIKYAKTISATKSAIKTSIFNSGSFPVEINKNPSDLQKSLIEQPSFAEIQETIPWLYFNCTPNARFENEYLKHILPTIPEKCPEYEIFNFCQSGDIFDFNHDGLSCRFIKNKNILIQHPHGKFPCHAADFLNSLDDLSLDYDLKLFEHWEIHPPLKEKESILFSHPYNYLRNNFNQYDNIFIMGYSFCDDGNDMNDMFYFHLISELASRYQKRLYIINPSYEQLAERLTSEIEEIYCCPIKWNIFANVFLNEIGCYPFINFIKSIGIANRLLRDEEETPLSLELAKLKLLNPSLWKLYYKQAWKQHKEKRDSFSIINLIKNYYSLDEQE
ncbi:hypothetical protein Lbir_0526 [Legionella birminghamensis]|uniref:SIR2-like domain-containing protein n=1 Tax=Legionella birminghamensis TaxID=28083 RepID=A0A378IF68_9GAMM|nr:hypothetical protein [Legionella birminghamensis]KTC75381.1 hypothetical protein Lbir_0526 [Legionella birminghamensis]STX33151.1 Uncharacterised protein [Legionella birminghamensis]